MVGNPQQDWSATVKLLAREGGQALLSRLRVSRTLVATVVLGLCFGVVGTGIAIATSSGTDAAGALPTRMVAPIFDQVAAPSSVDLATEASAATVLRGLGAASSVSVDPADMRSIAQAVGVAAPGQVNAYAFPGAAPYNACIIVVGGGAACVPEFSPNSHFGFVISDTDGAGGQPLVVAGLTDSLVSSAFVVVHGNRVDLPVTNGAFLWSPENAQVVDLDISAIGVVLSDGSTQVVET